MASSGTIAVSGANDDPIKRRQSCRTAKYEELVDVGKRFLIGFHGAIDEGGRRGRNEEKMRRKKRGGKTGQEVVERKGRRSLQGQRIVPGLLTALICGLWAVSWWTKVVSIKVCSSKYVDRPLPNGTLDLARGCFRLVTAPETGR
ncbi:hypothetical protein BHE74_00055302 [Ensete ventricosum]|nr:hypothetical protein BHE74_00055302 [Ensete ventricosum]